jgi:hypothetical protein
MKLMTEVIVGSNCLYPLELRMPIQGPCLYLGKLSYPIKIIDNRQLVNLPFRNVFTLTDTLNAFQDIPSLQRLKKHNLPPSVLDILFLRRRNP